MEPLEILSELPAFPSPARETRNLTVSGLVETALQLSPEDLAALPQTGLTEDFTCEEGWVVPDQEWKGIRVGDLLSAAGTKQGAIWIEFAAGDFLFSLPIEEARKAIVALELNDAPLTLEHGGPARLLVPGGACFTSIKWLERIEARLEAGPDQAAAIARTRIRSG
jgi:DMSO/TMAO reductase YedYZ molybdopterin-dependent catalytic subunit